MKVFVDKDGNKYFASLKLRRGLKVIVKAQKEIDARTTA